MSEFNYGENATITNTKFNSNWGIICTLLSTHFTKKVITFGIKTNLHAINIDKIGHSVVKDYLTTTKNDFIYNNISCQVILDNSILGKVRG